MTPCTTSALRRIWLCADDYGISPSVNTAIRDLVVRGRLNATSILIVAPSFNRSEAIFLNDLNFPTSRVAIGLHVALTAPFRPLSRRFTALRDGAFMPLAATAQYAIMRRFKLDELVDETGSQLNNFLSIFGRPPDFVDGHHHVHLLPPVSDALLEVTKKIAPNAWVRQCGRVVPFAARFSDRKGLLLDRLSYRFRRRAARLRLRTNPAFAGTYDLLDDDANFPALFPHFLDRLPEGGVVMCHPGFIDAELQRLDPVTTLREREYAFLAGDSFPAVLTSLGVALV